jgi:hypothetical protein
VIKAIYPFKGIILVGGYRTHQFPSLNSASLENQFLPAPTPLKKS